MQPFYIVKFTRYAYYIQLKIWGFEVIWQEIGQKWATTKVFVWRQCLIVKLSSVVKIVNLNLTVLYKNNYFIKF